MPNEKNLIPFTSDQSRDEAVKNGAKIIRPVMICVVVVLIVKLLLGK